MTNVGRRASGVGVWVIALVLFFAAPAHAQQSYLAYVASESEDVVTLVRFTPGSGLAIVRVIPVGFYPAEMEGPHGINLSPDGQHWFLTLGHGFPFGSLLKYRTGVDTLEAVVELGLFPATVAVTPLGDLALAVNANFHGEHTPSTVSIIDVVTMTEVDRIDTCTMPHGSRLTDGGAVQFHTCMMDDQLVEVDVIDLSVTRTLDLNPTVLRSLERQRCSPTWAAPTPDGGTVFVMCNRSDEILEVDRGDWRVRRRLPAPRAPYNAEVTPDGQRLVVTQKGSGEVSIWDVYRGERLALIPSSRGVTHGVSVTPDSRYAFISVEGVGGEPGAVDVVDLETFQLVGSIDVGKQAGGIIFWRVDGT